MLLIKFSKLNNFAYNSYLDCRDVIIQTIKRANIDIEYSCGFNPHELLFFSPPTSLGIESLCEYMYLITQFDNVELFKERFNKYSPEGLKVDYVKLIDKKPNFYDLIDCAEYEIVVNKKLNLDFKNIKYVSDIDESINEKIYKLEITDNTIRCKIACGQKQNLKISTLLNSLKHIVNFKVIKITKIQLFKKNEDNFIDIDSLL